MNTTKIFALVGICCVLPLIVITLISSKNPKPTAPMSSTSLESLAPSDVSPSGGVQMGNIAPDLSFQTIDGETVSLLSLRGRPVIISFSLTVGCGACFIEAENIREAQKQIPSLKVIQLAINPRETVDDLRSFKNYYGNPDWMIGFDKDNNIVEKYEVRAVDTTVLIDSKGIIVYRDNGDPIEVETIIKNLSL